jgi:hypothetical protein
VFAVGSNNTLICLVYSNICFPWSLRQQTLFSTVSVPVEPVPRLRYRHDGRRTAPPGTGLKLVLHRPYQYVRVPYCSMHVLVESLSPTAMLMDRKFPLIHSLLGKGLLLVPHPSKLHLVSEAQNINGFWNGNGSQQLQT